MIETFSGPVASLKKSTKLLKALTLKFINERHTACCNGDHESCVHLAALESVIGGKDENGDFDSLQSN